MSVIQSKITAETDEEELSDTMSIISSLSNLSLRSAMKREGSVKKKSTVSFQEVADVVTSEYENGCTDHEEGQHLSICREETPRIKYKDGHTMRRNPYHSFGQARIYRSGARVRADPQQDSTEVPVTPIDDYFDSAFWQAGSDSPFSHYSHNLFRTLNTSRRWEEIQETLKSLAVKITKEFMQYEGCIATHYDIPISGHFLFSENIEKQIGEHLAITYDGLSSTEQKKHKYPKRWLQWNGKFYDPSYIYQHNRIVERHGMDDANGGGDLIVVCPSLMRSHHRELICVERDQIQKQGSLKLCSAAYSKKPHKQRRLQGESNRNYVEIDLKCLCEVTHIGTLGGYPSNTMIFPPIDRSHDYYRRKRRTRFSKSRSFVYVVRDSSQLSWVSSYQVQFRDHTSGKWHQWAETLVGNYDVGTEVFQEVSIRTRYIRITPITFVASGDMRIQVYGKMLECRRTTKNCNGMKQVEHHIDEKGQHIDDTILKSIETIRYTIRPPPQTNYRIDGYVGKDSYWDNDLYPSRNNRHNKFLQEVADSIDID